MTSAPLPNLPGLSPSNGPAAKAADVGKFSAIDPLRIIREYATLLIGVLAGGLVLGVVLWFVFRQFHPLYTTTWDVVVTPGITTAYVTPGDPTGTTQTGLEQISAFIKNQTVRILDDDVINEVLDLDDVKNTDWFKGLGTDPAKCRVEAKDLLQKHIIDASQYRGSTLMRVELTTHMAGPDPRTILTALVNTYLNRVHNDADLQSMELRRQFVNERDNAENELKSVQARLRAYMIDQQLPNLQVQMNEANLRYSLLADQWAKLEVGYDGARDTYNKLLADQAAGRDYVTPDMEYRADIDQTVAMRDDKIRNLIEQRAVLLDRFGPQHRSVQDLDRAIEAAQTEKDLQVKRLIQQFQQMRLDDARHQAEGLKIQYDSIYPDLVKARVDMRDLTLKIQDYDHIAEDAKSAMLKRDKSEDLLDEIRVKSERSDAIRVHAFQPQPSEALLTFPPKIYITVPLVGMMCLALGLGAVMLKELLDQRIKSPQDIKAMPNTELLGVLPHLAEDPSHPQTVENVVSKDPAGLMAEAFRQTRTALLTRMDRRGYKTVMFSGATPRCGVSAVTGNLALSLAYNGKRVLVLDANLRRPAQHRILDCPPAPGLTDVLRGSTDLDTAIVHKTNPDLDVLTAGDNKTLHPELLESPAFRTLLTSLESRYDFILIDAPPALLTSDCQTLAKHADAAVFVVRAMADKRGMIGRMLRQFEDYRTDCLGVILNGARNSAAGYFKESYQQFYDYRQSAPMRAGARRPQTPAPGARV